MRVIRIDIYIHVYNCTPHESTKISPFELMFERKSMLPNDAVFMSLEEPNNKTTKEYVEDMNERITRTKAIVHTYTEKARNKLKKYFDKKEATIGIGEIVLVRIPVHQGRHTRADKVEDELYIVVEEVNVIPVYNIKVQQPLEYYFKLIYT